ncbi:hypothetical protein D3C80_698350 [compost metagenome]
MRQDEIALQRGKIGAVDLDRGELSETGIDTIHWCVAGGDLGDATSALLDARIKGSIENGRFVVPIDICEIGKRNAARMKRDRHADTCWPLMVWPLKMREWSGLKPMR